MSEPVIGLALGSGAARGWSHIGIIEVLEQAGIKPQVVAGCSIGAFVGAAYVAGKLEPLRDWTKSLRLHEVASMMDISLNSGGLIEGNQVLDLMQKLGIEGDIAGFDKKFASVATDYLTGREEWVDTGEIKEAVRASIALPGLFSPSRLGETWYVDGGLVNPVPVSTCRAMGANFVIAVNLNGDLLARRHLPEKGKEKASEFNDMLERSLASLPKSWQEGTSRTLKEFLKPKPAKPTYFDVLANSINIMQDKITRSRLAGEPPHVMITPRLGEMGIFDFDDAEIAIEEGRRVATNALPDLKHSLEL